MAFTSANFTPQAIDPLTQQGGVAVAVGTLHMTVTNITGDSSYSVGGSSLTPQQLGLSAVFAGQVELLNAPTSGTTNNASSGATLVITNGGTTLNLKCFTNGSGAASINSVENSAAANLSGITWQIIAFGLK